MESAEPGKWFVGAGLLVLGMMLVFAGLALGFEVNPFYLIVATVGILLDGAIIDDQILRNLRIARRSSSLPP